MNERETAKLADIEPSDLDTSIRDERTKGIMLIAAGLCLIVVSSFVDRPGSGEDPDSPTPPATQEEVAAGAEDKFGANVDQAIERERQRSATVQLRFKPADGSSASVGNTHGLCTAAHIGDGWFVTARHCFRQEFITSGLTPQDAIYDLATQPVQDTFTVWSGSEPSNQRQMGGAVDHILLNGNEAESDLALLHVPGAENLPAIPLSDSAHDDSQEYRLFGYAWNRSGALGETSLAYLDTMTGGELGDPTLGDAPMLVFSASTNPEAPGTECKEGESGGVVSDGYGAAGTLSRYEDSQSLAWYNIVQNGVAIPAGHETLCMFTPLNLTVVQELQAAVNVAPPEDAPVL